MKFLTFVNEKSEERLGILVGDKPYDLSLAAQSLHVKLPSTMNEFLALGESVMAQAQKIMQALSEGNDFPPALVKKRLAPVPHPTSCRDAYAFRQHVEASRRNRGVEMILEFDQFPVFYFTNHNAIVGEGPVELEADHFKKLDFELEVSVVIGKRGKNIPAEKAEAYIAGYTIMNDLSARELQMDEMKLNLGPAKGKDFATVIGPYLVTPDELKPYHLGSTYDLSMKAFHNGKQVSAGNMKDMNWSFAEIIERCSYGVELYPGDVIGSGTVGTGCYLELNGTWALEAKKKGEPFTPIWLQEGDEIRLEVAGLGILTNTVHLKKQRYSILEKKKKPLL